MKRRTVLKGAAAVAGATVLGAEEAEAAVDHRIFAAFNLVLPGPYAKLSEQLQEGVEGLLRQHPEMTADEVHFDPQTKNHGPWLVHPTWESDKTSPHTLFTPARHILKDKRWDMVKRAVDLRLQSYWRQENPPPSPWDDFLAFRKEAHENLGSVYINWMAQILPPPGYELPG